MTRTFFTTAIIFLSSFALNAQNLDLYKSIVKELGSEEYQGRGYAYDGVIKAGNYLAGQFEAAGVDEVSLQPFKIDINTFPGNMELSVDGHSLKAGEEFVTREFCPGVKGTYKLYYIDTTDYNSAKIFEDLARPENKDAFVVCDFMFSYRHRDDFQRLQTNGMCQNKGILFTWDAPMKFYKANGERVNDKPVIWVHPDFPKNGKNVTVNIENKFFEGYESNNVIAKINGKSHDSCYVFIAHYDHMGNLGRDVYYPGVNDNASGTAGIITFAEYYSQNRPQYDMYFIAFAGEEAGLRGSIYFVEHPTFDISKIKYLFNLDMIGDNNPVQYCEVSEQGMSGFHKMEKIAADHKYFEKLELGELAANSDHWPFAEKGVPCILFENEGGDNFIYYHTIFDTFDRAVFSTYISVFKLITEYIEGD